MAAQAALVDGGTLTQVFIDPRERDAAYDFVENPRVSSDEIQHAMAVAAAQELAVEPFVWLDVDGTSLTLPDSHKTKGMGRIGSGKSAAKGMKVITCVVVDQAGVTRGAGEFKWWVRTGPPNKLGKGKVRIANDKRHVEDKETKHWVDVIQKTRATWMSNAAEVRRWWVIDREADTVTMLHSVSEQNDLYTIRSNVNRRLVDERSDGPRYLRDALASQPVRDEMLMQLSGKHNRQARIAKLRLRTARVALNMRDRLTNRKRPLSTNVVWVQEVGTTPAGEDPIEWVLYTNHCVDSEDDMYLVLMSYMQRWRSEDFHRTWKRGACRVEDSRLGAVQHTQIWATVLAAVAIRIERLKLRSRAEPDVPASEEFSDYEIQAIRGVKARRGERTPKELTLRQAVYILAELGGYTGRSSGGAPGSTVIGRGLERLGFIVEGIRFAEQYPELAARIRKGNLT